MFELSEEKNYWCLASVSRSSSGFVPVDTILLIHASEDAEKDDLFFDGYEARDNGIDVSFADDQPEGIYRLTLDAIYVYDTDDGTRYISGVTVKKAELVYEFPSFKS